MGDLPGSPSALLLTVGLAHGKVIPANLLFPAFELDDTGQPLRVPALRSLVGNSQPYLGPHWLLAALANIGEVLVPF